jgi:hypothetical protein
LNGKHVLPERENFSILGAMGYFDLDTVSRVWDIVSGVGWEISMGSKGIESVVDLWIIHMIPIIKIQGWVLSHTW